MQRNKGYVMKKTLLLSLLFIFAGVLSYAGDEEYVMIVVEHFPKGLSVDPVKAKRGTTIIWVNYDPGPIIIKFTTKLGITCSTPTNFYGDMLGFYETGEILQGQTASICFIYEGQYDYEMRRLKSKEYPFEEIQTGRVIVE